MKKTFFILLIFASLINCRAFKFGFHGKDKAKYESPCESGLGKWKCCASLSIIKHHPITVCVQVKILAKNIGFRTKVTLNNETLFDNEVSVRNPPPLCGDLPFLRGIAGNCIHFYDLVMEPKSHFSGCVRFSIDIIGIFEIINLNIGCFFFPLESTNKKPWKKILDNMSKKIKNIFFKKPKLLF